MYFSRFKFQKGFTLMEVMVAVSIFTIIVTVGIGSLLTINDAYRRSQTQRQAIDSLTYTLESMSRRIRTAQEWSLSNTPSSRSRSFEFTDQDGIKLRYYWDEYEGKAMMEIIDNQGATNATLPEGPYDLTPGNVEITTSDPDGTSIPGGLTFISNGGGTTAEYLQINVGGYVANGRQISNFAFQTGVSKRSVDRSSVVLTP